ncbi:cyanophycinase [Synechococcus sp. PCC 7335]|uniref:cyanophycinase n=1 Tax=Synechococcus sp. (strain ATCC 29403 / PCC 7335) TaxID=91464 RepID=UPI001D0D229B|nr:cyanophycinase [Synechococcus sp. PCC 7335]
MTVSTQYPVMIIGGAEDKTNGCTILNAFVKSAGGSDATIGIIPSASREPAIVGDRYYQLFTAMGALRVQILDIRYRSECEEARWIEVLNDCSGIFITGGDQLRLRDLIGGTRLLQLIKEKLAKSELVLAGTSAGAAVMGEQMIAGGSSGESPNQSLVDLTDGLGFVPELLVDQHFHNRNRMARLLSAIAAHPNRLGVGIDEDTCIAIANDGIFQVLGKGTITVIDPGNLTHTSYPESLETSPLSLHNLKVHVLNQGDRYDYKARALMQLQSKADWS